MCNKKTVLIIIIATMLAFLTAWVIFKKNEKPLELKEDKASISEQYLKPTEQSKDFLSSSPELNSEINNTNPETVKPNVVAKPVLNTTVTKDEPVITPLQVKLEVGKIEETKVLEDVYKDGDSTVVVTREFKFKSPARYSFK